MHVFSFQKLLYDKQVNKKTVATRLFMPSILKLITVFDKNN